MSEGGAGGIRTRVQTRSSKAFYELSFLIGFRSCPGQKQPKQDLASKFFGCAPKRSTPYSVIDRASIGEGNRHTRTGDVLFQTLSLELSLTSYRMIRLQERKKFRQLLFEQLFNEGPFNPRLAYHTIHLAVKTSQPQRTLHKGTLPQPSRNYKIF